jgi:hypothetical protein
MRASRILLFLAVSEWLVLHPTRGFAVTLPLYPVPETAVPAALSPFSVFSSLSDADLARVQAKLTYIGSRTRSGSSILWAATLHPMDISRFRPFWRLHTLYWDEYSPPYKFRASIAELRSMLVQLQSQPGITDGGIDDGADLSFAMQVTQSGSDKVFEAQIDREQAKTLFTILMRSFGNDADAVLRSFGCSHDFLAGPAPVERTSEVEVTFSEIDYGAEGQEAFDTVQVTNIGKVALQPPLLLVVNSEQATFELVNQVGTTCLIWPTRPYVLLSVARSLAPGVSVTQVLRLRIPDQEPIRLAGRLFAGAGTP